MGNNRGWTERAPREELEDCLRQALAAPATSEGERVRVLADAILSEFLIAKVPPLSRAIVTGFTDSGAMVQIDAEPPVEFSAEGLGSVPWIYQVGLDGQAASLAHVLPAAREVARLNLLWGKAGALYEAENPGAGAAWGTGQIPEEVIYEYTKRVDAEQ